MEDIREQREKPPIWAAVICAVPAFFSEWAPLICAESILILLWAAIEGTKRVPQRYKKAAACCLLIVPVAVSVAANFDEEYVRDDDDSQGLPIVDLLSDTDIDHRYRLEYLSQDLVNSNLLPSGNINKASIYSSVSNSLYGSFYYDAMKNPISIRNRVALLPDANPLFNYFMGIRYVAAAEDRIPYGYEKIEEEGGYVIAENSDVLPMCYGSYGVLSEEDYEKLPFPQNLEALVGGAVPAVSTVRSVEAEDPQNIRTGALEGQVMIVTFDVNRADGREVVIEMNGMKNKLSASNAPYPNRNYTFTYIMQAEEDGGEIEGIFSEGDYEIENLQVYVMDMPEAETVMPVSYSELKKNTVFAGSLEMEKDGYFVTSFPYKKGYEITVDGKRVSAERVNLSFMGFPVEAGYHEIEIRYTAPGFRAGIAITIASLLLVAITELIKRRRTKGGER